MKMKSILIMIVIIIIIAQIPIFIIYSMARQICDETEIKPIRYVPRGLFGVLTQVETTPGNEDAYGKVCVSYGEPKFYSVSENIEYLLSKIE